MLFLSSGTVDTTPRTTTFCQQQQTKTVYNLSVILKESERDEPELEGMGQDPHTQAEQRRPRGERMSVPLMENSPRTGRARQEPDRSPSLCRTGAAGKAAWFLEQTCRKYSALDRDVAKTAAHTDGHQHYIHSSGTLPAPSASCRDRGSVGGHSSLPRAVLRRPCQGQCTLDRRTLSMYGEPAKQQQETKPLEPQLRLRRPRSVCMLPPGPLVPEARQPYRRQSSAETVTCRTRRAELRAVDGLGTFPRPLVPPEVTPRIRNRSWRPRPVSMTVLELRKKGSEDDLDGHRGAGRDGVGFFKGGFRRLFGKDKNKDRETEDSVNKFDPPRSALGSLKRSLSLRIRRTRPRDVDSKDSVRIKSTTEQTTAPSRPFSYLTGRALPMPNEKVDDRTMQYIKYHSMGKVKVMEVPLCPSKLSKPAQEEPSLWQLIASRFRRKEQTYSGKSQVQHSLSKSQGQFSPSGNNGPQPVAIETDISAHKGQDSFVNSQEWTLSRSVPELKVGIVGNLSSGKSALVHRYLTGTYVQEESPEGGRFKKEIVVDGQSYLLLIRDEGGPPELQFAAWVDAVVFVFSLEDEISFQTVYNYFLRLSSYRNTAEVPMVLVGTQDAISAANPRVIDDSRARKLSNDLKRCTYYETCSTYGLNVERVFQDVAQKVVAMRKKQQLSIGPCKSLPNSPSHSSVPAASLPSVHINQASNGGGAFSDYSSSVPSTPSISQREMRIETIAASNTPTPIRKQSKRRSNIFTVVTNHVHQRNEPSLPVRVMEMPKHATYPVWVPEWQAEREFQLMTF
ncbi:uncharacterized protein agap3 isoform X4 [Periophthalmus magnuspinnatus]|uniref:uncharacterized protein agap3 isoform X4 n=1 Tax=Periophthalmus magnuspinnatus TaxID=409849 RepID=UPI0024373FD7|nr:uncharacterized protein agap3 isoform X4 [Periophthalmus magnuspinnatus]